MNGCWNCPWYKKTLLVVCHVVGSIVVFLAGPPSAPLQGKGVHYITVQYIQSTLSWYHCMLWQYIEEDTLFFGGDDAVVFFFFTINSGWLAIPIIYCRRKTSEKESISRDVTLHLSRVFSTNSFSRPTRLEEAAASRARDSSGSMTTTG